MAHPKMYDDGDPHFQRVRTLALALPGAQMKVSQGQPAFFTTKVFAYYGCSVNAERARSEGITLPPGGVASGDWSDYLQYPRALVVRSKGSEADFLAQDPRVFRPAYLGAAGWLAIDLSELDPADGLDTAEESPGADDTGWSEIAELLESSYRLTAPARLVRSLDD